MKSEKKRYILKLGYAGRDHKCKTVGHSDERALRNSGKVIKSNRQI